MIFVIGGRQQGKTEFALELAEKQGNIDGPAAGTDGGRQKEAFRRAAADGRTASFEEALSAPLVLHLEAYVRRAMEEGKDPYEFAGRLMEANPQAVLTADEIGYGIVPIDAFEREYRDTDGRVCQRIAAGSGEVYRVVCGIGTKIKG